MCVSAQEAKEKEKDELFSGNFSISSEALARTRRSLRALQLLSQRPQQQQCADAQPPTIWPSLLRRTLSVALMEFRHSHNARHSAGVGSTTQWKSV